MKRLVFPTDLAAHTCTFVGRSTVGWVLHGLVPAKCLVFPTGFSQRDTHTLTFPISVQVLIG